MGQRELAGTGSSANSHPHCGGFAPGFGSPLAHESDVPQLPQSGEAQEGPIPWWENVWIDFGGEG